MSFRSYSSARGRARPYCIRGQHTSAGVGALQPVPQLQPVRHSVCSLMLLLAVSPRFMLAIAAAFSSGGGNGIDENGIPFMQSCDAISVCQPVCPPGMTAVAPPERSSVYQLRVADSTISYHPGELVPLELEVTQRTIPGKRNAGAKIVGNETAKYLGLLLYAVDDQEVKVGSWVLPLETPARFWLPKDPGCSGKSVMHADAVAKHFKERFVFRAPAAGTGRITFRALIKQGETNRGAFYWIGSGAPPAYRFAGGDLTLSEAAPPSGAGSTPEWLRATVGESCAAACARAGGTCDEAVLQGAAGTSASGLLGAVEHRFLCTPPMLAGCEGSPRMSGLGDGFCWYHDSDTCPAVATSRCEALSPSDFDLGLRLCPCTGVAPGTRRALESDPPHPTDHSSYKGRAEDEDAAGSKISHLAEQLSAQGIGCPNARLARAPTAACPKLRAMAIAAQGGLTSATADDAFSFVEGVGLLASGSNFVHPEDETADDTDAGDEAEDNDEDENDEEEDRASDAVAGGRSKAALLAPLLGGLLGSLMLASRALRGHRMMRRDATRSGQMAACMLASTLPTTSAHNWIASPRSRAGKVSMTSPCKSRTSAHPGVMVNRGQEFVVEWSTGHPGRFSYITLLSAEDEGQMKQHTVTVLEDYLNQAPPEARQLYAGEYWDKSHVGWVGGRGGYTTGLQGYHFLRYYEEQLLEGHPQYKQRAYSPNHKGDGQNVGQKSMVQFSYKAKWKAQDKRELRNPFPPHLDSVSTLSLLLRVRSRASWLDSRPWQGRLTLRASTLGSRRCGAYSMPATCRCRATRSG